MSEKSIETKETPSNEEIKTLKEENKPTFKKSEIKGLFIDQKSTTKIDVYLYIDERGEVQIITGDRQDSGIQKLVNIQEVVIRAEFSIPSRKQMELYRRKAGRWIEEAQSIVIDRTVVRNQLLRYHLMKLDVPDEETGETLVIEREKDRLSEKTEESIYRLHPTIIEVLLNKYVIQSNLIF